MKRIFAKLGKSDIWAKFFRHKAPNLQVMSFDKLLYTELENVALGDENLDEVLFDKACDELGIKERFDYAMSYILQDDKALVFLTLNENLEQKCDFAFAEPLLWRNLRVYQGFTQTQIPPFYAVFVLSQNYGYVVFLGDEKLLYLKNLPQFTLKYLQNKDKAEQLSFIDERICEQSRVNELCKLYQSKAFVFVNDELNLSAYLSEKLEMPHIKAQIQAQSKDLQANLAFKEAQRHDEKANFLQYKADDTLLKRLLLVFALCFALAFSAVGVEFFIKWQQLKSSFERIDEKKPSFDDLQKENSANALLLKQKKAIIAYVDREFKPVLLLDTLEVLFELLYQKQIKPQSLKIEDKEITLLIPNDEIGAEFIKELYANDFFTLKHKELAGTHYELVLERK